MNRCLNYRSAAIAWILGSLTLGSCTWEEFPGPLPERQKPVDLNFTTAVNPKASSPAALVPAPGTRSVVDHTDFDDNISFPAGHTYPIGIFLSYLNGTEVFDGSQNMRAMMTPSGGAAADDWKYYYPDGGQFTPKGLPGKLVEVMAYHPWSPEAKAYSIPFDFTHKVNGDPAASPSADPDEARAQTNLLLCKTNNTIKIPGAGQAIPLGFTNVYTKVVLLVRKKEEHSNGINNGRLTQTSIQNLSSSWIKNRGGIDPATGYVRSDAQAGPLWDDTPVQLSQTAETQFTFLVPAFMDANVKDDAISFVLTIDNQQRIFPLKRSHLNQAGNRYGFEQNRINTYHLVYNNAILLLSLTSWNSVEATAEVGKPATNDPSFILDLTGNPGLQQIFYQESQQTADLPDYPKDNTPNATSSIAYWKFRTDHLNNTYLSSVLLGGNGPNITDPNKLYKNTEDGEMPYQKLQVTGIDIGNKEVVWQDAYGGLIAKNLCRNYRGGGHTDWRLPRVTEMKSIIIWTLGSNTHVDQFFSGSSVQIPKNAAPRYWTATEADMGTPGQVDDQETAWYVIFYSSSRETPTKNYRVATTKKSEKAFIRCVREI